jgi:hypothetical protein
MSGAAIASFRTPAAERKLPACGWRINGHPARLLIWSPEEWEELAVRPIDAQYHPFGVWCALRLVE